MRKQECLAARAGQAFRVLPCQRLLRLLDFFSPPWLLRLLEAPLPRALARSLWALLFCVLALPPLLAAWARLELLLEDLELRDAIDCSLLVVVQPALDARGYRAL